MNIAAILLETIVRDASTFQLACRLTSTQFYVVTPTRTDSYHEYPGSVSMEIRSFTRCTDSNLTQDTTYPYI